VPAHRGAVVTVNNRPRSLNKFGVKILAALGLTDDEP
jgi:hypothetical protein